MARNDTKRRLGAVVSLTATAVCALIAAPAGASGDYGPERVYTLVQTDGSFVVPFLAPSNDSRANLMMLMADAGIMHARLPPAYDASAKPDAYAGQAPIYPDTFADIFDDRVPPTDGSSAFVSGDGDRCRSNAAGSEAYLAALSASAVPAAEQTVLADGRRALLSNCASGTRAPIIVSMSAIRSAQGRDFTSYLFAAANFYYGDFASARRDFAGLQQSRTPWLKEAARYMVARVDINQAGGGAFGDYGELTPKGVDAAALKSADAGFKGYLADYPRGAYANSARGLLRRVAWLGGDRQALAAAFGDLFAQGAAAPHTGPVVELAYEADNKVIGNDLPTDLREPHLLAVVDLMAMRRTDGHAPVLTRAVLDGQRPLFASQKALYDYLQAAYAFYGDNNPAAALKLLNAPATAHMSSLQFSQQVLKGLVLESLHSPAARAQWLALIPLSEPILQRPAIELALAQNYENHGEMATVFAPNSPIHDQTYRSLLLSNVAGPDLLRQRVTARDTNASERQLSLYVLLLKELMRGRYQPFVDDLHLMPADLTKLEPAGTAYEGLHPQLDAFTWSGTPAKEGFACPAIRVVAATLARSPRDERSLLCLGEFIRIKGYDDPLRYQTYAPSDTPKPPVQLGSSPTQFPGTDISRLDVYRAIIKNTKADPEVRAYALYRAVYCWAPAGYNSCDGSDASPGQRKQWHDMLKAQYPGSTWAQKLKYYW